MYVSIPKNYSGMAFPREAQVLHPDVIHPQVTNAEPPMQAPSQPHEAEEKCEHTETAPPPPCCADCNAKEKNPLTCFIRALQGRKKGGFESDDFLLLGLIVLLLGKEGNEDILLILAMLLLI